MEIRNVLLVSMIAFLAGVQNLNGQFNSIRIRFDDTADAPFISKHIYGQFAEHLGRSIYDGFYRNGAIRSDIVAALKQIRVPNLRWPGGCFAEQYHWRDGIGVPSQRTATVNTTWGMVIDDNSFGTDEFMRLCKEIGCQPYIAGNVATGSPEEMKDWIEYLNFNGNSTLADLRRKNGHVEPYGVSFWGVGNESWGCGGLMSAEIYAAKFRQYGFFCKNYPGSPIKRIAAGARNDDYHWTEVCMRDIPNTMLWGLSFHYYAIETNDWNKKGPATGFDEEAYFTSLKNAMKMQELVEKHSAIMDKYDPDRRIALVVDEWGIWTDVEKGTNPNFLYQQNTLRDALIAATTLNIFNNNAQRVRMANLAQTINVLQSLILTKDDELVMTPTYYVFDLYKNHQDAKLIPIKIDSITYKYGEERLQAVNGSASLDSLGNMHITMVNIDPHRSVAIKAELPGKLCHLTAAKSLTSKNYGDFNSFTSKDKVLPRAFEDAKIVGSELQVELPGCSIVALTISK